MPNPKELLPEPLIYIPWWRKGDPGPDWPGVWEEISLEARVQHMVIELNYEKEVMAAQVAARAKAIDAHIAALGGGRAAGGRKP
ncbi:MAG: hypothetical protein ACREQC_03970 [Candidatus Binataceae bacterium]